MSAVLRHRGPDSWGGYYDTRVALYNTRLSIIDLSSNADLPMANGDKSVWMAYNGEVTNFQELKSRFRLDEKYQFRSHCDSEVVLHLYEELGLEFLKELSGMFAFCLYDSRKRKVYLVRDFYGLRPLFYMVKGHRVYFASEIKAFLELPCFRNELDLQGIYHYFSLAYIPGKHTPFKDIQELEGGHLLEFDLDKGKMGERRYHGLRYEPDVSLNEDRAVEQLRSMLLDSVRRNLISDAPAGLTFSGGFDTSSLLVLTKRLGHKLHTFSIKMDEPSFDESRYQKMMLDYAEPIHHEIIVKPEQVLENMERHMAFLDEPSGDGGNIPFFLLAEEAKKYVKVLLSGEGGDEIFNAYETHRAYRARKFYRALAPKAVRSLIRAVAARLPTSYSKLSFDFISKRFTEGTEKGIAESHIYYRHPFAEEDIRRLFVGSQSFGGTGDLFNTIFEGLDFGDDLDKLSWLDIYYYFIGDLMVKNDRMVMAHSIEARYPYMDEPLVDFMRRVPGNLRVRGMEGRYIQKQAMKGLLPKSIQRRKNMGLEMPHSIWFLKEFKPSAERYFSKEHLARCGLFDSKTVQALWTQHLSRGRDNGRGLWSLLMFLVWYDVFVHEKSFKRYLLSQPGQPVEVVGHVGFSAS